MPLSDEVAALEDGPTSFSQSRFTTNVTATLSVVAGHRFKVGDAASGFEVGAEAIVGEGQVLDIRDSEVEMLAELPVVAAEFGVAGDKFVVLSSA